MKLKVKKWPFRVGLILLSIFVVSSIAWHVSELKKSGSPSQQVENDVYTVEFPSKTQLLEFLEKDNTDEENLANCAEYSITLKERAHDAGIQLFYVILFQDDIEGALGHSLLGTIVWDMDNWPFTSEYIWIEPQTDAIFDAMKIGDNYNRLGSGKNFIIDAIFVGLKN